MGPIESPNNDDTHETEKPARKHSFLNSGFLVTGLLWGFLVGYSLANYSSKSIGYQWYHNPYPRHFAYTIACLLIGPAIGLIGGIILDSIYPRGPFRGRLLKRVQVLFVVAILIYGLFLCLAPLQFRE